MKENLLILALFTIPMLGYSQSGTQIDYVDNFGPATCVYNGLVNGKHSYRDAAIPIDIIWSIANNQWEIYFDGLSGDLLFSHPDDGTNPPSTDVATWTDEAPDPGGDGTTLTSLTGTGTAAALPVELIDFSAQSIEKNITLKWKTATETNNAGFELQRSSDNQTFERLSFIEGKGTTDIVQNYSFDDDRLFINQVYYYRLKQIDYDGQFVYSDIVSVDFRKDTDISIAPNPVKDKLNITNAENWKGTVNLLIFTVNGQLVQRVQYDNPDYSISLNIQDLRAGMYHVQIVSNNQTVTQRFVKN